MKTRKSYSKVFKLDAIALVRKQNYSIAEAARNLELTPQLLGRWIKESENDDGHEFRVKLKCRFNRNPLSHLSTCISVYIFPTGLS